VRKARKSLEATADRLWQDCIRLVYNERCALCGYMAPGGAGHHIIKRRRKATRWAVLNGIFLCPTHHRQAEEKPKWFLDWLAGTMPDVFRWVETHKRDEYHGMTADIEATVDLLRQLKKTLEGVKNGTR